MQSAKEAKTTFSIVISIFPVLKVILETCLMPEVHAFESYNNWWDINSGGRQSLRSRRPTGIWKLQHSAIFAVFAILGIF